VVFECRYNHDWPYTKALADHIRARKRLPWIILLVLCCAMLVFCLWVGTLHVLFSVYFILMIAVCVYRVFLWRRLSSRAQWERVSLAAKSDSIETVFTLDGQGVRFAERGIPAGSFPWTACAHVAGDGDWLAITMKGKKKAAGASLFLPRKGFADGTGEAFLAWLAKDRPELVKNTRA